MQDRSASHRESETGLGSFLFSVLALLFFLLACFLTFSRANRERRTLDEPSIGDEVVRIGFAEYQDHLYFPVRAMITGVHPYMLEYQDFHPLGNKNAQGTSPTTLLLGAPLGLLSIRESENVYLGICLFFAICMAGLVFRSSRIRSSLPILMIVAGLMMICVPGKIELLPVGIAFPVALGVCLALEFGIRRPFFAGVGLLLTTCYLATALPLFVLMLFRGEARAVVWGVVWTMVAWFAVGIWVGQGDTIRYNAYLSAGVGDLIQQELHRPDSISTPAADYGRVDVLPWANWLQELSTPGDEAGETEADLQSSHEWTSNPIRTVAYQQPAAANKSGGLERFIPDRGVGISIGLLVFAAVCLLAERNSLQRIGLSSRTGLFIVLMVLTSFPHFVNHVVLLWVPIVALIIGGQTGASGMNGVIRFILSLLLLIPVFVPLPPDLVLEQGWAQQRTPEWFALLNLDSLIIATSALMLALRLVGSRFLSADRQVAQ